MTRTKSTTIAAVLLLVLSLLNAVAELPNLASGTATGPDQAPFAAALFSFTLSIVGVFAAYGLWQNMRWGKVLALIVLALSIVYSLLPVIFAPVPNKIVSLVLIALYILVIALVLRSAPSLSRQEPENFNQLVFMLNKHSRYRQGDYNSLLSGGLLVLLLISYIAMVYVVTFTIGTLAIGNLQADLTLSPAPWWLNLTAIALLVLTLRPVSRWLRERINDLIYAQHDNPYALIAKINRHLQAMTNPHLTLPLLVESIGTMLYLPYVSLDLFADNSSDITSLAARRPISGSLKSLLLTWINPWVP